MVIKAVKFSLLTTFAYSALRWSTAAPLLKSGGAFLLGEG